MNATASLQTFMEYCLEGYKNKLVVPFIEDLLIYSATSKVRLVCLRLLLKD